MIPKDTLIRIVRQLLEKTSTGAVKWHPARTRSSSIQDIVSRRVGVPRCFMVNLEHSRIYIEYESPQSYPDFIRFEVCRDDDAVVGSLNETDGGEDWELLCALHTEASRAALGWDSVLEEIESALHGDGPIGSNEAASSFAHSQDTSGTFLAWLAGAWLLKYTPKGQETRTEDVLVRDDGTYEVAGIPKFKVVNVDYDATRRIVSFDKAYLPSHPNYRPARPVHHREDLTIVSPDAMVGHRHGEKEHVLDYTRVRLRRRS